MLALRTNWVIIKEVRRFIEHKSEPNLETFYIYIPTFTKNDYRKSKFNLTIQNTLQSKLYRYLLFKDLENLAHALYADLENDTPIAIFPPEPEDLEFLVENAIEAFNSDIQKSHTFR